MNSKKIVLFSVILIIAISSLSMVSAGWFDSGKTTVNGIEFNVDGFKESEWPNDTISSVEPPIIVSEGSNVETKLFHDDNSNDRLTIRVYDNPNGNCSLSNITYQAISNDMHRDNWTYADKEGIKVTMGKIIEFAYIQDGKLVVLRGPLSGVSGDAYFKIGDDVVTFDNIILK